ncbi:Planctomycete cytochrome C [Anatilimnocola aggregata]|uniref:Planctomycete cytochrome C n=1 Tax=Anatilimnocola aggregata TaxID=2528021 RepID=A0A517YM26_9BACT|nr:PSD1 and planctomycete cytochrome C domain-containing protein [Anatilimnocola aggregata]QDU31273.1 Planctomycete cytochrome C [Anatilimnocola aggregata]
MKLCCSVLALLLFGTNLAQAAEVDAVGVDFFEKKIRPVLVANCYQCHSASSKEIKGELRVDTKQGIRKGGETGPAVIPGKPGDSLLIQALRHEDGLEMPPKQKLSDDVIADFTKWVQLGAPDPREATASTVGKKINLAEAKKFWSLQPAKLTPPAAAQNAAWARTPIDRYVIAGLEANKLAPVADADKATLIRRLYFDLIGLPPTPEEVDAYVHDRSPKATEALVDRLLASPRFGERWGRHWLDVARFGESTGKERNVPYQYAWRYRNYVIDAFASDKPFDQFIREQIAGDLLPAATNEQQNEHITATGFLALSPRSLNERNPEQFAMDVADEQIDVTTRAFMAISVACARCHDHKFDPIQQQDYYALAGIFRSTQSFPGVKRGNNKTGYEGDFVSLVSTAKSAGSEADRRELARLDREIAEAKRDLARAKEALGDVPAVAPNRLAAKPKNKNKLAKENKRQKPNLANPFQKEERRLSELSNARTELEKKLTPPGENAMGVRESAKLMDCHINIRGEVNDLGDEVDRGLVRVLMYPGAPQIDKTHSGRLQLAAWIANRSNPLTARVMANRVWFHLFGRGLVETIDNFGALGETPSHPELLDYLAVRFMDQKWSTKQLIREIVLSRTYQLSSAHQAANYNSDPENKYLWRMSRRRLEAEAIRDAVLATSGRLNLERPAGSPVMKLSGELGRQIKGEELLQENTYRSCYLPMARGYVPEFLNVFDMADPELVTGQRDVTTVATQALYLMNSPVVQKMSEGAADRVLGNSKLTDDNQRIDYAFRLIVGHGATSDQMGEVQQFLNDYAATQAVGMKPEQRRQQAWTALCHTLYASAEFRYVY